MKKCTRQKRTSAPEKCLVGSDLDIRSSGRGVGAIYYYDEEDHGYSDSDDDVDGDDDDDLPEPQAPLSPCRPAVVQVIVQRSAGRKRTAHDATTPRLERTRRMPSCQLSFCKHLATALSPFDVSSLKHCVPVSIK